MSSYPITNRDNRETRTVAAGATGEAPVGTAASILPIKFRSWGGRRSPRINRVRNGIFKKNKPQSFDKGLAKKFGIPFALVLQIIENKLLLKTPSKDETGTPWFVGSPEYIRNVLPFLTEAQIRRALVDGRKQGVYLARRTSEGLNAGMAYTIDLSRLRELRGRGKKADQRISVLPCDVRDHGLHAAVLLRELAAIQREHLANEHSGGPLELPSLRELAEDLPMSGRMISKVLAQLKQKGIVRMVDPDGPPSSIHGATVCDRISLPTVTPPWDDSFIPQPQSLRDPTDPESPATARYTSAAAPSEQDVGASAPQKAAVLLRGVNARSRLGYITDQMRVLKGRMRCAPNDEYAATVFFAHNPDISPWDVLRLMEVCVRHAINLPPARQGEFDPDWHARKARDLQFVLSNWGAIIAHLPEPLCDGHVQVMIPDRKLMYPRGRRRLS